MGFIHENITIKNACDVINAGRGIISESQVRQVNVQAVVDTGAFVMIMSEEVCNELGLTIKGDKSVSLADRTYKNCKITEPVEIHWKDRFSTMNALVLPGANEILLGVLPLEDMDLIVDPKNQKLIGAHGDKAIYRI